MSFQANEVANNSTKGDDLAGAENYMRQITSLQPQNLDAWEQIKTQATESGDNKKAVAIIFEILDLQDNT